MLKYFKENIMFKKYAFIVALLPSFVLTNISYAACTQEEKEAKIQLIIRNSASKVASAEFYVFIDQLNEAANLKESQRDEACQKYDEIIEKYGLSD